MNELQIFAGPDALTMSSLEIADLTGKLHRNVKRDILAMTQQLDEDMLIFERIYKDTANREQTEYLLDKDHTFCLVSGYNAGLRMAIIKRWQELEVQVKHPVELTRLEILTMAIESERKVLAITAERDEAELRADEAVKTKALIGNKREASAMATASVATRKVKQLEKILERNDCRTLTDMKADTGMSAKKANIRLEELGYVTAELVKGKRVRRLTKKGETIAKEFPGAKFIQIGILPDKEQELIELLK